MSAVPAIEFEDNLGHEYLTEDNGVAITDTKVKMWHKARMSYENVKDCF